MLNIINIVRHTEEKISKQIDSAVSTVKKAEEKNRVARRKSEAYFNVLVRASLGVAQSIEIDTYMQALCVAAPEFLFNGIFKLGYGESRHGKKASEDKEVPQLLRNYYKEFENETVLKEPVKLIESIKNGTIDKALLCHGLSACNDTILLLADIELLTNPPNFVNVTRYHDKNLAKIAEIFQRKRSWFPMPWPLSSF